MLQALSHGLEYAFIELVRGVGLVGEGCSGASRHPSTFRGPWGSYRGLYRLCGPACMQLFACSRLEIACGLPVPPREPLKPPQERDLQHRGSVLGLRTWRPFRSTIFFSRNFCLVIRVERLECRGAIVAGPNSWEGVTGIGRQVMATSSNTSHRVYCVSLG